MCRKPEKEEETNKNVVRFRLHRAIAMSNRATMDNVIQLLNASMMLIHPKITTEEIALIYQYLIDKFGDTSTTAFKLHEVLISLAHVRSEMV